MTVPLETYEQVVLANWLRGHSYMFCKSPSETYTTSWAQKKKNKMEGVTKGFPDICIILKNNALLFIELKRQIDYSKSEKGRKMGTVSKEQKQWITELNNIPNVQAEVAWGAEHAIEIIKRIDIKK